MTVFTGPLIYLTDGAPGSLELLPQVTTFAEAIGSHVILAQLQRDDNAAPVVRGAGTGTSDLPPVVPISRRKLGAGLMAHAEVHGGALALQAQRRGGFGRFMFGSLHERLIRETPLSLLTLPADGKIGKVRNILFPADLAPRSLAAFDATLALCQRLDASLDLLHVYGDDQLPPSAEDIVRRRATTSLRELLNVHREGIVALVERARAANVRVREHAAEGRAHSAILAFSAKNPVDLIAMATYGPRTVDDILNGSTTSRVVQRSPVPVLVFRA